MSSRRNRDRSKSALPKLDHLPRVSYEEVAQATYGRTESEIVNQWFGDISPGQLNALDVQVGRDGAIAAYDYRLTGIGLDPNALAADRQSWQRLGALLFRFDRSMQWLIGDWLLQGERNNWGQHDAIARRLGYDVKTLYDYRYVARHVDFSVRTEKLSFGHHKLVAHLDADQQRRWLARAVKGDRDLQSGAPRPWSISRLRKEMLALPASASNASTPFERNLQRINRDLTQAKWQRLPAAERRLRYDSLQSILARLERWGVD